MAEEGEDGFACIARGRTTPARGVAARLRVGLLTACARARASRAPRRLEPLVLPPDEVQRAAFVPLFKGGKRIHLAVQVGGRAGVWGAGGGGARGLPEPSS